MPDRDWQKLYDHWFGEEILNNQGWVEQRLPTWFFRDPEADRITRERFAPWLDALTPEEEAAWRETPRGFLTLILLFDQVPRNAFRGTPRAFRWDTRNLAMAEDFLDLGWASELSAIEAFWTFLPFQHQEDVPNQERSVRGVNACAARCQEGHQAFFFIAKDMARRHYEAIALFGRFPHRNTILTRESTPDEMTFLEDPKNHF